MLVGEISGDICEQRCLYLCECECVKECEWKGMEAM